MAEVEETGAGATPCMTPLMMALEATEASIGSLPVGDPARVAWTALGEEKGNNHHAYREDGIIGNADCP